MSVINNVLKDLETRESRFTPIEITSVESRAPTRREPQPLALIGLLLLALAAAGWVYIQNRLSPPTPVTAASAEPALPVMVPLAADTDAGAAVVTDDVIGNQIIGLQIRESEQEMRMEFALRDKVVVYLKDRAENSFGYHLRAIESQILAPAIADNRWIRELAIVPTPQGVDINFETAADILVETRQHRIDGEQVWAINLRQAAAPPVVTANRVADDIAVVEPVAVAPAAAKIEPAVVVATVEAPPAPIVTTVEAPPAPIAATVETPPAPIKLDIKSTNPNAKSENQLERAVELINSRRLGEAEALLRGLLGGNQDYRAREHLLGLYGSQNRNDRFARLVRDSTLAYPQDRLFKTEYARSLFQQASYRAVIQLLAREPSPDANQQALVAASHQRLDQHQAAVRHYRLALAQDAGNAKNWIGLGISQEHNAALRDALASYQRAGRIGSLNSRLQAFVEQRSSTLRQVLN